MQHMMPTNYDGLEINVMQTQDTFYPEVMRRHGVTRRSFLRILQPYPQRLLGTGGFDDSSDSLCLENKPYASDMAA